MDIAVTKKKSVNFKRIGIIALIVAPIAFLAHYVWVLGQADFGVESETVVVGEVKRGNFKVSVRGTGTLVPDKIRWLSAEVEANVTSLAVKAGNQVKTGDLLVELSNPRLVQELAETQWQLEAEEAELKAAQVAQESALLEQEANVLNAKLDYESSSLEYVAQGELISINSAGAAPRITYKKTGLETDLYKQRWLISQKRRDKMRENLAAQNNARAARLNLTKKRLERIQQQVDDLQVKATMDSIVLEMPLEPGQRIVMGSNITKLAEQNSLIAELQIPEIQIRGVAPGQPVTIDTRNSKINGVVSRVDPAVVNGSVQVDVTFTEELPADARPDLSVDGEIIITEIADTLYVDRPLFAQSQSRSSFYKLSPDGQFAERVEVTVGSGSVNQIQITEGLNVGDKIVTSDVSRFETYKKIRIK
ncbi:MAG: efflux RND transporter periplasmic adaptor subunit [Kordiimonas sp.]